MAIIQRSGLLHSPSLLISGLQTLIFDLQRWQHTSAGDQERYPLGDAASNPQRKEDNRQLVNKNYHVIRTFRSLALDSTSHIQDNLVNRHIRPREVGYDFQRNPYASLYLKRNHCSCTRSSVAGNPSLSDPNDSISGDNSYAKDATMIQEILKSHKNTSNLESALDRCMLSVTNDLVVEVLRRHRSDWNLALSFFEWASNQRGYAHDSRAYNEMLDILGRMKQIKRMRQMFDEIPSSTVINDRTFAILMNRYAGAHKVQEAIETFYKRRELGFELDMVGFQTLLMSLCRHKHVEEAESLFRRKQDDFPPVIKSRNIILNGWCVMGRLREAKRFWNDIISSECKPDLITYGTFINSLTKSGNLGTAVNLFTTMWAKGCPPDVAICNCIIDALCFKKKIPEALKIFGEMDERGCLPDIATYNSLIKHICKIRRMDKVYELLDEMERKGCIPNARTYSYILKTAKGPEDVADLLRRMERTSCRINSDTYNLILNLYVGWKYQRGIRSIWSEMERNGLGPDQRSYTIMIHGLQSQEKLDEALEYYREMRSKGMCPEPRTRILVKAMHLKKQEMSDQR